MCINSDRRWGKLGVSPYDITCERDEQVGRYRKRDAYDCGNTRCLICHSDKTPKRLKHEQELLSDLSFVEQLKELE